MPITPIQKDVQRDSDGYELDAQGNRIYPHWAGYVPAGARTTGSTRPPWVPSVANYWDDTKPPRGWFKLADGSWGNIGNEEHVKAHPELNKMMVEFLQNEERQQQADTLSSLTQDEEREATDATAVKDVVTDSEQKPADPAPVEAAAGIRCKACEKPFPNPALLMAHMKHHKKSDQHHAEALKTAEEVTK